jgi:hypothetical protein
MDEKIKQLYQQMADLTLPKCGQCRAPHSCCDAFYCEVALEYAKECGDDISHLYDEQAKVPFLRAGKCAVSPHLRPMCTMHVCSINSLGFDPKDEKWTADYFRLRGQIEMMELEEELE